MNLEDILEQQKKLQDSISRSMLPTKQIADACQSPLLTASKIFESATSLQAMEAVKILKATETAMAIASIDARAKSSCMLDAVSSSLSAITSSIEKLNTLTSAKNQVLQSAYTITATLESSKAITQAFSKAVTASEPYIPAKDLVQAENAIPAVQQKKRRLSLSDILTLISILLTLYTLIVSSRPNDQLDRIIAQNDTIISQQEKLISMKKEDLELMETLDTLRNTIDFLTDEAELLREEPESSDDLFDGEGLSDLRGSK